LLLVSQSCEHQLNGTNTCRAKRVCRLAACLMVLLLRSPTVRCDGISNLASLLDEPWQYKIVDDREQVLAHHQRYFSNICLYAAN
jgi:hypothetical protein